MTSSTNTLCMALKYIKMPSVYVNIIRSKYKDNMAYAEYQGDVYYLFHVLSGVITSCPLSSVLFNFCIDSLLWLFSTLIVTLKLGLTLACADDIAASVRCLSSLVDLTKIFDLFGEVSGLLLHPKKCVIVLLSVAYSADEDARPGS